MAIARGFDGLQSKLSWRKTNVLPELLKDDEKENRYESRWLLLALKDGSYASGWFVNDLDDAWDNGFWAYGDQKPTECDDILGWAELKTIEPVEEAK